jgi:von Willebrand factor type A domain-containing protein
MGRHADTTTARRVPRPAPVALVVALVVVALVAGGVVWFLVGRGDDGACGTTTAVRVSVAPELEEVAGGLLADPLPTEGDACAAAEVTGEQPAITAGALQELDASGLPDVWVPDSTIWPVRATDVEMSVGDSMATSPLVIATARNVAEELGWLEAPPTWNGGQQQVAQAGKRLAALDLATSTRGLATVSAVSQTAGGGDAAEEQVLAGLLAIGRNPGPPPEEAMDAARADDPGTPSFTATEQDVIAANQEAGTANVVAVYAADGVPVLDYPVVRIGAPTGDREQAVAAVLAALTSGNARDAVLDAGFRDADGDPPTDVGEGTGTRAELPETLPLDPADVWRLADRVATLAQPSRLLTVIDVSRSMEAPVGDGTRIDLARDAAKSALPLFPDTWSVGLWTFAFQIEGEQDWSEQEPVRALDADIEGRTQRNALGSELDQLPDELAPGGTGLYDTTLAAVRAAREDYEEGSVSSVVLLTDGADDDSDGISLPGLIDTLRGEADEDRPVQVIAIGLGPDADLGALQQIAEVTGGQAYPASQPEDVQAAFLAAVRQRR